MDWTAGGPDTDGHRRIFIPATGRFFSSLGMAEAKAMLHLTSQSNSGMVDPVHMTAISLLINATSFLTRWPNANRLVVIRTLDRISRDIGSLALRV